MTFVSTNHTILQAGLRPVFADVDEFLCLDPDAVRRKISPRTRAVAFVGLGGNTGHYKEIVDLCQEKGLALILDAAHMAGTRLNGQHVGREADAAVFSFHAVKNLPTADSGMICFKHHEDDQRVRKLTWLGISEDTYSRTISDKKYKWRYDVEEVGFKYHGNSIMAAIGLVQLRYLDEDNAHRRQLSAWYREALSGTAAVKVVPTADGCESSTHLFQVLVRERDALMLTLHGHEVYPGVHYRDNTDYSMYAFGRGTCPRAHQAGKEIMSLPLHLNMNQSNVDFVSSLLTANAR